MKCIFCEIIRGAVPGHIVFEDESTTAFLDVHPLFPGHTLVCPREHIETLPDVPTAAVGQLFANAQMLCRAVESAMGAEGTFVAINNRVSQTVPHLHVHVVPRRRGDGLKGFFWPRSKYRDDAHAAESAAAIREAVKRLA